MGLAHSPRIVTNGLVLCLDAGNTKSYPGTGTTWTDLSSNRLNGTLSSVTYSSANNSIVFDGLNSTSNHGTSSLLDLTTELTLECWIYPINDGENQRGRMFNRSVGANINYQFLIQNLGGINSYQYITRNNLLGESLNSPNQTVKYNVWSHVAVSHVGGTASIYINGDLSISAATTQPLSVPSADFIIGNNDALDRTFNGNISNVKIYNRALTTAEIQQNFNALRGRFGI